MEELPELGQYLAHLGAGLGHAHRQAGLRGHCSGLMAPRRRRAGYPVERHPACEKL